MIAVTYGERISNTVWWFITSAITIYLFYGVYNTFLVVTR